MPLYTPFLQKSVESVGDAYGQNRVGNLMQRAYLGDDNALGELARYSPQAVQQIQQQRMSQQQAQIAMQSKQAETKKANQEWAMQNKQLLDGMLKKAAQMSTPEEAQQVLAEEIAQYKQSGVDIPDSFSAETFTPQAFAQIKKIYPATLTKVDANDRLTDASGNVVLDAVKKDPNEALNARWDATGKPRSGAEYEAFMKRGGAPTEADLKAEQLKTAQANAGQPLPPIEQAALDIQTWNYINSNGKLPYRKAGGGALDKNEAIVQNAAKVALDMGISPQELLAKGPEWKADAQSLSKQTQKLDAIESQLSSFHNNLDTWNSLAEGVAPQLGGDKVRALAKDLKKIDFTGIRSLDEMKLKVEQEFNDPTASAIAVAAMAAAMDYARIMQGPQSAASLTEGARQEAERLISMSADEKGRKGIMAALESDTEGQVKGLRDQREKIRNRLGGKKEEPPAKAVPVMSDADQQAAAWAKANPSDPRAKKILEHLNGL